MINMCVYGMMIALVLLGFEAARDQKIRTPTKKRERAGVAENISYSIARCGVIVKRRINNV